MRHHLARFASLLFVATAAAQTLPIGTHVVAWANTSGSGTPTLSAKVYYPAIVNGVDVPVLPKVGGWPTVVFLHGVGMQGSNYGHLAAAYALHGFIAVMIDTAPWVYQDLESDGRAMFGAIAVANDAGSPSPLLIGAFDMHHIGLVGHSMGGGVVGLVLADNPGYCCGMVMAPVYPGTPATQVRVPFGILAGNGDNITTWFLFSYPYFVDVAPDTGLKFLYVLDADCDHLNIAGLTTTPNGVFEDSLGVQFGFLDRFLAEDASGLEHCVGPTALAGPRLYYFEKQMIEPQVWSSAPLTLGSTVRLSVLAGGGLSGMLAALATGPGVQTVIGTLMLDPGTLFTLALGDADHLGQIDSWITVPNLPPLVGQSFALQAAGATPVSLLRLGSAVQLYVQ